MAFVVMPCVSANLSSSRISLPSKPIYTAHVNSQKIQKIPRVVTKVSYYQFLMTSVTKKMLSSNEAKYSNYYDWLS